MKSILLFTFLAFSITILAQEITPSNILNFTGEYNSHESFYSDKNGFTYVAGKGSFELDFELEKDLYIIKYQNNDELVWIKSFDGSSAENQIASMLTDDAGNVYVLGSFDGTLNFSESDVLTTGTMSVFLSKLNADGGLEWVFPIGNDDREQLAESLYFYDDRLIVQFTYKGDVDVDPSADETILDENASAVVVYDRNGNLDEAYSYRGGVDIEDGVMDSEGNLYLSGQFSGIASLDFKSNGSLFSGGLFDGFVAKYSSDFDLEWISRIQKSVSTNTIHHLALNSNEDLIASASIEAGVPIGTDTIQNNGHYLLEISKEGEITNPIEFLPDDSFITDLEVIADDKIIATGCFINDIDIDPTEAITTLEAMADGINFFFGAYNSDYSLIVADQIYATAIPMHSIHMDENDKITVLTDFQGNGKIAFGIDEVTTSQGEENFVLYNIEINDCIATSESITLGVCDEAEVNGVFYNSSGSYEQALTNADGCDSTLTIELTIFFSSTTDTAVLSCGPYTYEGQTIGVSGNYELMLISAFGCDSIVNLELEVIDLNQSITINGNELIANEADGDVYQWYDCISSMAIEGATGRVFTPEADGSYRVQVFKDGCSFFSDCAEIMLVNTSEISNGIMISPNPTDGIIFIHGIDAFSTFELSIHDLNGRLVKKIDHNQIKSRIDMRFLNPGTYLIKVISGTDSHIEKIIRI